MNELNDFMEIVQTDRELPAETVYAAAES